MVFAVTPTADYTLTRWMKVSLAYVLTARTTNASALSTLNLVRHDAQLRLNFSW
jgi:hypothetical protein